MTAISLETPDARMEALQALARFTLDVPTRRLIPHLDTCGECLYRNGRAVTFPPTPCVKCKGTGTRGRGKCRECKGWAEPWRKAKRLPVGHVPDYGNPVDAGPCRACEGTSIVPATMYTRVPVAFMTELRPYLPVRVYRRGNLSIGESMLGMAPPSELWIGMGMGSVVDYGRTAKKFAENPEAATAEIADAIFADTHQGVSIADKDTNLLADHIGILLAPDGYTKVAMRGPVPVPSTAPQAN